MFLFTLLLVLFSHCFSITDSVESKYLEQALKQSVRDDIELKKLQNLCSEKSSMLGSKAQEKCLENVVQFLKTRNWNSEALPQSLYIHFFNIYSDILNNWKNGLATSLSSDQQDSVLFQQIPRVSDWDNVFTSYGKAFPDSPDLQTLAINQAHQYSQIGQKEMALILYHSICKQFNGQTRFGAEARFFGGQCAYQLTRYQEAEQLFRSVLSVVFLPVSREQLNHRIVECVYRQATQTWSTSAPAFALKKLDSISKQSISRPLLDTILLFTSDRYLELGDTLSALSYLQKLASLPSSKVKQTVNDEEIYLKGLFNQQWILSLPPWSRRPFDSLAAIIYMNSTVDIGKKSQYQFNCLVQIIQEQNVNSLSWFIDSILPTVKATEDQTALVLLVLRLSEKPECQKEALRAVKMLATLNRNRTKQDSLNLQAANSLPTQMDRLESLENLYRRFYAWERQYVYNIQVQTQASEASMSGAMTFSQNWEQNLLQFLLASDYTDSLIQHHQFSSLAMKQAMERLSVFGEKNSELAFYASKILANYYRSAAKNWAEKNETELKRSERGLDPLEPLGLALLQIRLAKKALAVAMRPQEWVHELESGGSHSFANSVLHPNSLRLSRALYDSLPKIIESEKRTWEALRILLRKSNNPDLTPKKLIALEMLCDTLRILSQLSKQPSLLKEGSDTSLMIEAQLSYLYYLLWFNEKLETSSFFKAETMHMDSIQETQTRIADYCYQMLIQIEPIGDPMLFAKLGSLFQVNLDGDFSQKCKWQRAFRNSQKWLCLSDFKTLPSLAEFDDVFLLNPDKNQPDVDDPLQQWKLRKKRALFHILCEAQRIRQIKTTLRKTMESPNG